MRSCERLMAVGARGVGEVGIVGVSAAIANAVCNATGKRIRDLPRNFNSTRACSHFTLRQAHNTPALHQVFRLHDRR